MICDAHALLMANHGAITVGDSIWRAWERMETLEQLARVTLVSRLLGGGTPLAPAAVDRLMEAGASAGYPPPSCDVPGAGEAAAPTAAGDDRVVLSRAELVRLIAEAVERFGGART